MCVLQYSGKEAGKGMTMAGEGDPEVEQGREPNWCSLCRDLVELILARLDTCSAIRASAVCRRWRSVIISGSFLSLHLQCQIPLPWFFIFGMNDLVPARSQGFAFSPDSGNWLRLPPLLPPPHNCMTLAASAVGGFVFALVGAAQSRLCYTPGLMRQMWRETAPMRYPRGGPGLLIGAINCGQTLVVAGGDSVAEQSVVEIYHAASNTWQNCPPLPPQASAAPLTCAMFGDNFYIYGIYSGSFAHLDVKQQRWSATCFLKPPGCVYAFLITCESMLVLIGVCTDSCLKVWQVDPTSLACKELGQMPNSLFSLFHNNEEDSDKSLSAKCTGDGRTIYIYSDSKFHDYSACFCRISLEGGCSWGALPALPPPVNRFDRVIFGSSVVGINSCFANPNNLE